MDSLFLFLIIMKPQNLLMKPSIILPTAALLFFCASALSCPLQAPPADTLSPARKAQPLLTTLVTSTSAPLPPGGGSVRPTPGAAIILRILNDSGLRDYANIVLDWELRANGLVRQKGSIGYLPIPPKHPAIIRLPVRIPSASGEELFLGLHYRYRNKVSVGQTSAAPGRVLADELLLLKPWTGGQLPVKPAGELSFTDSNGLFTIQSPAALLRFDKQTGWLQSYEIKGNRLVEDMPGLKSHFWLAPGDPGYAADRAALSPTWKEASQAPHLQLFSTSTGSQLVIVRTEYTLPETSCLLHLSYTINATGEMQVEQSIEADSTGQGEPLPCFGMYWKLPPGFDSVTAYGGTPIPAYYHTPVTPFRENNTYTGIRYWMITRSDGKGLRFTADSTLLTISTQSSAPRLIIDNPALAYHLPYGNYRYAYKVSPVLTEEKPKPGK